MVCCKVCGIIFTLKVSSSILLTVKLTPFTQIEPFCAMYFEMACGAQMANNQQSPKISRCVTWPMPSTWPLTKCPPNRSFKRNAFSRLTVNLLVKSSGSIELPRAFNPVVTLSVSLETCASKWFWVILVAVKQTPFTAILSPIATSVNCRCSAEMVRRISSPIVFTALIWPTA